jgi:deoxyribodipyrimidine photo-lyase
VTDAVERLEHSLGVRGELSTAEDWGALLAQWATSNGLQAIVTAYAPVGPVAELLLDASQHLESNGVRLVQLRRPYDTLAWPYAKRGYFKFRQRIPALLEQLGIRNSQADNARDALQVAS